MHTLSCNAPTIPLPAVKPGLSPLPGPTLLASPPPARLLGPAEVTGGRRVAAIPAGLSRVADAVEFELTLPRLPVLAVLLLLLASDDAGRGTLRVEDGFRVVVGTKPDDGFLCDWRGPADETESGFRTGRFAGTMGDEGMLRLLRRTDGAKGAIVAEKVGIEVWRPGDAKRGRRDTAGAWRGKRA